MQEVRSATTTGSVDEDFFSRQLYVVGHETMQKLRNAKVLLVGLSGVGVETAKNLILMGIKHVTLHDTEALQYEDLSSHFFAQESSVGKNRVDVALEQLRELNSYVDVNQYQGEIDETLVRLYDVVVFTGRHIPQLIALNKLCRENNVKFIAAETRGLACAIFVDFGKDFVVTDNDGETPAQNIVVEVTNGNPGVVFVHDEKRKHGMYDGDWVIFEGITGMEELNTLGPVQIKSTGTHTFTICDTSSFGEYVHGGKVIQVKKPMNLNFKSLEESLANQNAQDYDFAKMERTKDLHAAFRALSDFSQAHNRLPRPYNEEDAAEIFNLAKKYNENANEKIAKIVSYTSRGNLNPMAAFVGGYAAQEVQKALSGKFHPLDQWLYFEAFECLPSTLPTEADCKPANTRYDGQVQVFGHNFQKKLMDLNVFLVGSGALGCEYLKNFALMGVSCGKGKVVVTDMDSIEVSNLNRQFLFRKQHVQQMKSFVAAQAAKHMNNHFNVEPLRDKVAPETEQTFDDDFWERQDAVTNALDNILTRRYVDSRCVRFRKPLIEAGTLGTKANVQMVVPGLTEPYSMSADPEEDSLPLCTVKNFPNAIEHTIAWAREKFEEYFNTSAQETISYTTKPNYIETLPQTSVKGAIETILEVVGAPCTSFDDCVVWARLKFEELFANSPKLLLHNFPAESVNASGAKFWDGSVKKAPKPLVFSAEDYTHLSFIRAAAILRANLFGIAIPNIHEYNFHNILEAIKVPEFVPKSVKIAVTEEEGKKQEAASEEEVHELKAKLPAPSGISLTLSPISFEKDDDTNHHIAFITATSNLRARNFQIKEATKHETKGIAGKIIPAMVTTTALITGLGALELYKLAQGKDKIEDYKNSYINLAIPLFQQTDPVACPTATSVDGKSYTLWDTALVDLGKDVTLNEFLDHIESKYDERPMLINYGQMLLYSQFEKDKVKLERRLKMKVSEVIHEIAKVELHSKLKYLYIDTGLDIPTIKYRFRY